MPIKLTNREREILVLLCRGYSQKQVALELGIQSMTVKSILYTARMRNEGQDTLHLVALCYQQGAL